MHKENKNQDNFDASYLGSLSEIERRDVLNRWRCKNDFGDGNAVGTVIIDNFSLQAFIEFREISRKYFGNNDGPCVAGLLSLFKLFKLQEKNESKKKQEKKYVEASDGSMIQVDYNG